MTSTSHTDAVDQIRVHLDLARRQGRRRPGRPALVEATGLSDHAVRTALDAIKEGDSTSPAPAVTRQPRLTSRPAEVTTPSGDCQLTNSAGNLQPVGDAKPTPATSGPPPATSPPAALRDVS